MLVTSGLGPGHPEIRHMSEMSREERVRTHGHVSMEPLRDLVAGEYTTVSFTLRVGEQGIQSGGRFGLTWRWPYDWGDLQEENPQKEGYLAISVAAKDPGVVLKPKYYRMDGIEPWHHLLVLDLVQGKLRAGDEVRLTCGDRSQGNLGWRAPTCRVERCGFLALVDAVGSGRWIRLPDAPSFRIVAGAPASVTAVAPSEGVVDEPVSIVFRVEDRWGNPLRPDGSEDRLRIEKASGAGEIRTELDIHRGEEVYRFNVRCSAPGVYTFRIAHLDYGKVETNPVRIDSRRPESRLFWGDLHSGQTEIGCGAGTLDEHFRYGRDVAAVHFMTHQANDHYMTVEDWRKTREISAAFNEPGRFVTFLGCEWSPETAAGGDRNVFYREDESRLRRSGRFFTEEQDDPEPDIPTVSDFHAAFRDEDVLVGLHVGGRMSDLDHHEPRIERLAEIHSTHGTSEWFIEDALERGYKVGITGGTDGVMTRPAADHPGCRLIRNVRSGLTAVYARELTRTALWEALMARRCYATTGERIALWVDVDGHPMGDDCEAHDAPCIQVRVAGTGAIERVDILRGTDVICGFNLALRSSEASSGERERVIRMLWSGTNRKGTAGMQRLAWDGLLTVEHGTVGEVRPVNFQSPCDRVSVEHGRTVSWRSTTAGSDAGLILTVDCSDATRLFFQSEPAAFSFSPNEVAIAPMTVDAGGFNRRVVVGPAPDPAGPRVATLTFRDEEPFRGVCPYWVRVIQVDRARAWSSPVYVTRR